MLLFGLSTACYVFTKLMRPLVRKCRGEGRKCVLYLDDGIFGGRGYSRVKRIAEAVKTDLLNAGLTINATKSNFVPTQKGMFLGFILDTTQMLFSVPTPKLEKLMQSLRTVTERPTATPKEISRIAGQIISMGIAIGPLTRLFTRHMYAFIESRNSWFENKTVNEGTHSELTFWKRNVQVRNGFGIKRHHLTTKVIYSNASENGYGGYLVQRLDRVIAQGQFSHSEKGTSSTHRELFAVLYVLQSLSHFLRNESILWYTDNSNIARIIEAESTTKDLQMLALQIFALCIQHSIAIHPTWIPREENALADRISKHVDTDDWSIDIPTFQLVQNELGFSTIDRFADDKNTKHKGFNSKFFCPNSAGVNAFTSDWSAEYNWLCPPISLVGNVIKHLRFCKARGILITPEWPSAYYWPILTVAGGEFRKFVRQVMRVDPFYTSVAPNSIFTGFTTFKTPAMIIDFTQRR